MKAAEDGHRYDAAHVLDGATDRSVFVERPMSPQLIIISGILRQYPAQVRFAQNNHMVDALASQRIHGRQAAAEMILSGCRLCPPVHSQRQARKEARW